MNKDVFLLLGDTVLDIKLFHEPKGENEWLNTVLTYFRLEKNGVINFPLSGERYFQNVPLDQRAKDVHENAQTAVIGWMIQDIYFDYTDEEIDPNQSVYIEFSNGYVLVENRIAPYGTGGANLFLFTKENFQKRKEDKDYNLVSITKFWEQS